MKQLTNKELLVKFFNLTFNKRVNAINPGLLAKLYPIANETQKFQLNGYVRLSMNGGK